MITSEKIKARLWNGANELRGSMDVSLYKDYMLAPLRQNMVGVIQNNCWNFWL